MTEPCAAVAEAAVQLMTAERNGSDLVFTRRNLSSPGTLDGQDRLISVSRKIKSNLKEKRARYSFIN